HGRLVGGGPAGREQLLRVGAGARRAGPRQLDLEAPVVAARSADTAAGGADLGGIDHFLGAVHGLLLLQRSPERNGVARCLRGAVVHATHSSVQRENARWIGSRIFRPSSRSWTKGASQRRRSSLSDPCNRSAGHLPPSKAISASS